MYLVGKSQVVYDLCDDESLDSGLAVQVEQKQLSKGVNWLLSFCRKVGDFPDDVTTQQSQKPTKYTFP
jgi:hypothetical protein